MNFPGKFIKIGNTRQGLHVILRLTCELDKHPSPENFILTVYSNHNIMRWKRYDKDGFIIESAYKNVRAQYQNFPTYEEMVAELKKFLIKEML